MPVKFDHSTVASHPGKTKISSKKFLDYHNVRGLRRAFYAFIFKKPQDQLDKYPRFFRLIEEWKLAEIQFEYGCLNPSMIIDIDKGLIATFTNLTNNGSDPTPVVKISQQKLHLIQDKRLYVGQKIPSVSLYFRSLKEPEGNAWGDFEPLLPHYFSESMSECDDLLNRLNDKQWKCLEFGLEQVQTPTQTGLYHVVLDAKLVNTAY